MLIWKKALGAGVTEKNDKKSGTESKFGSSNHLGRREEGS
jgi:hypothetical protein